MTPNEPIPERYACQRCGRRDGLDAVVPDYIWAELQAAAGGVNILCLWCMDALADLLGIKIAAGLYFSGRALHADHTVEHREASMIAVRSAVAREREECARLVERWRETPGLTYRIVAHGSSIHVPDGEAIARAIRHRAVAPEAGPPADATN